MKKTEINLPNYQSKKDILFRDFIRFKDLVDINATTDGDNVRAITYAILSVFYSISKKTGDKLQASQVSQLVELVNIALSKEAIFEPVITYQNKRYGFLNFDKITFAELVDLEDCYKEDKLIELTSIVYRPIKGTINKKGEYEIEEYQGYDDTFANVTLDIVEGYMKVFQTASQTLKASILTSMGNQIESI